MAEAWEPAVVISALNSLSEGQIWLLLTLGLVAFVSAKAIASYVVSVRSGRDVMARPSETTVLSGKQAFALLIVFLVAVGIAGFSLLPNASELAHTVEFWRLAIGVIALYSICDLVIDLRRGEARVWLRTLRLRYSRRDDPFGFWFAVAFKAAGFVFLGWAAIYSAIPALIAGNI